MTSKSFGAKNIDVSSNLNVSGVGTFTTGLKIGGYLQDKDGESGVANQVLISTGGVSPQVDWANLSDITSNSSSTGIGFTDLNDTVDTLGSPGQLVAVNSAGNELEFIDFSAPNLGSGTLPSNVEIPYSQVTNPPDLSVYLTENDERLPEDTNTTYQLKARKRNADDYDNTSYTDNNPFLYLDSSDGSDPSGDDSVRLVGGTNVTITRNNDGQITFSSTDTNTIPGNGTITINQAGSQKGTFTVNQSGNTTINLTDTNTDTDTNYYLTGVEASLSNSGSGSSFMYFNRQGLGQLNVNLDAIGVKNIYNHKMSGSPYGTGEHQFMMTNPVAGYRQVVTDSTAKYYPSNDTAEFKRLNVTSTKKFSIDHPLGELADAPRLRHSCIEGPELTTFYRGKIQLVDGTATINIDTVSRMTEGTFVALNRNIQSFTTNETGWTQVKSSVSGNVLTIIAQDNNCTDTISWMVLGERKDDAAMEDYDENGFYNPETNI